MKRRRYSPAGASEFWQARLVAGLTRQGAAALLHVSERTVRNWEHGRTVVPYSAFRLVRLWGGFDLRPRNLFGGTPLFTP